MLFKGKKSNNGTFSFSMGKDKAKSGSKGTSEKTIEEKYKKLNVHDHALRKPGMYMGSVKKTEEKMWIYSDKESPMTLETISYVPGFYKIYDEAVVNAKDRTAEKLKVPCTKIMINVDKESGEIKVWNNGDGVDVEYHKDEKMYVPSMVFGEALTSTQYDEKDDKSRITGGTNGIGIKLTNIYSTNFEIETVDAKRNKKFNQKFSNNMYTKNKPTIKDVSGKSPYTFVKFTPDFEKFGLKGITSDMFKLMKKRAFDVAMSCTAKVYFNDELITANTLQKYANLAFPISEEEGQEQTGLPRVFDIKSNKRWKIGIVYDSTGEHDHQNISFVNGICTHNGGTHVDYVVNQVVAALRGIVEKKTKCPIKPQLIKDNLIFFIDATIVNPEFDSQSKDRLKTPAKEFGSEYVVPKNLITALSKTGIVEDIVSKSNALSGAISSKLDGRKVNNLSGIEKLCDAQHAGTKKSEDCGLFLTEGDSAKALAMGGFAIIGRDKYGVYPLRGKLKNMSENMTKKDYEDMIKNKEIQDIMKILGLKIGVKYDSIKDLRYGFIVIMTDQDVDGFHIKGLLMNFINRFWPSLIKYDGFIRCFPTPIAKMSKGKGAKATVYSFYNIPELEKWKEENNNGKGWTPKYYKGLGTSNPKEAQEYFEEFHENLVSYYCEKEPKDSKEKKSKSKSKSKSKPTTKKIKDDDSDSPASDSPASDTVKSSKGGSYKKKFADPTMEAISLAFDPKRADDRKVWMNNYDPDDYINGEDKKISYTEFIDKELRSHAVYNAQRAIPNIMDGLKPSQRKILFTGLERNLYGQDKEIRVAQYAGSTSEKAAYHHGEASLQGAIVKMAQTFVGSNNINLLVPDGQFGTRLEGGDDAASARYIHTYLNELVKYIFNADDLPILENQMEDNDRIEPKFYAPIIPMVLVNGVNGIGTGYSSTILQCNPVDLVENTRRLLDGKKCKHMVPFFRYFKGEFENIDDTYTSFIVRGKYDVIDDDTIHITELPVGTNKCKWIEDYKTYLTKLIDEANEAEKESKKATKTPAQKGGKGKATKGSKTAKKPRGKGAKPVRGKTRKNIVAKSNTIGKFIKTWSEKCTDMKVDITITFQPGKLQKLIKSGKLEKDLKLTETISLTNMNLFNEEGKLVKYGSYEEILENYVRVRLDLYQKRKDYLLKEWKREMSVLEWKVKFIEHVIDKKIKFFNVPKKTVEERLEELEFPKLPRASGAEPSYFYTEVGIWGFTKERVDELKKQLDDKKTQYNDLKGKTPTDMWKEELNAFIEVYEPWCQREEAEYNNLYEGGKSSAKKKRIIKKKPSKANIEV